jgi:diacylglycerol kinase family enzyme
MSNILFLHNPLANEGFSLKSWEKAVKNYSLLPKQPVNILNVPNLVNFLKEQNADTIAVAGGDGTINTVCRAVLELKEKPRLAVLPFGFGNALSYCLGVETIKKAMDALYNPTKTLTIDLMKIHNSEIPIGVFNISLGFDARIVHYRHQQKYIGFRSYLLSGVKSFFDHSPKELIITIDHCITLRSTTTSLVIANCPIIGKNYVISDHARLNDGLLDCTFFSTKYAYITNLRLKGFQHPFYSQLGKVTFKAKHIRVESEPYVQVDGNPLSHDQHLEVEVLPHQVTFLCGKQSNADYQAYI